MLFSKHPSYSAAQARIAKRFRDKALVLKHVRPVLFLCGGFESTRRKDVANYLERHFRDLFVFFAEDVWEHVKEMESANALEMETQLANLADILVIVVESPGTFTELGAFSALDPLRDKLLPLVDKKYKDQVSFINTGPIAWVNKHSRYRPTIHCDFGAILLSGEAIIEKIKRIPDRGVLPRAQRVDVAKKPKHLLFLLSDIVAVTGPTTETECKRLLGKVLGEAPMWDTKSLLGLLTALRLVKTLRIAGTTYYFRPLEEGDLKAFQSNRLFDLAELRADFISTLQCIPDGRRLLQALRTDLESEQADAS